MIFALWSDTPRAWIDLRFASCFNWNCYIWILSKSL